MRALGVPRRTAALIGANSLSAAVQGQFQFVLPWMLLTRGHSPQTAAFAAGLVYAPLLLTAVPAGAPSDNADPRKVMRIATVITLVACVLYPIAALAGHDMFVLVLVAAVVVGTVRNFTALPPAIQSCVTQRETAMALSPPSEPQVSIDSSLRMRLGMMPFPAGAKGVQGP